MSWLTRASKKASRWVRRQRDKLIDEAEVLVEETIAPALRSAMWRFLRQQLAEYGISAALTMKGSDLQKKLGSFMEDLEPWQREVILRGLHEAVGSDRVL